MNGNSGFKRFLARLGVTAGIFALLSFLQCKVNSRRKMRSKQALMPAVAVVYSISAIVFMLRLASKIYGLIQDLLSKLYDTAGNALNGVVSALIGENSGVMQALLGGLCLLAVNIAVYAGFLALKAVCCGIFALIFRGDFRFRPITEIFYDNDSEYGLWFLKDRWTYLRRLFLILTMAGAVICGAALAFVWHTGAGSRFFAWIFPVFVQIVICEIYCFLNGYTKQEYRDKVLGDDSISQRITNYYHIREVLERIFGKQLITASTGCEYSSAQSATNLIEELKASADPLEKLAGEFFEMNQTEVPYETDYIRAGVKLLKGTNVVFLNPFYRDLGRYIALPMMKSLLAGKKVLVVTGRLATEEGIRSWLSDMLYEYSRIRTLWRVECLSRKEPECEVGILTLPQLYDLRLIRRNEEFFSSVGFVLLAEPSLQITAGQLGLGIISGMLGDEYNRPVYCVSDRMVDGLVDTVSHVIRQEITEVVAPPVSRNIHTAMSWDCDGDFMRERFFGKQVRFMGNGMELAAVSLRNQIPHVTWLGGSKAPVRDIRWIVGGFYPTLCKYINAPIQQQSIYDRMEFLPNIWEVPDDDEQFLLAEDEFDNIFAAMRLFFSRGRLQSFVNIFSEDYLLRDYMRVNSQMFSSDPNLVPSLVPDFARTERNTLYRLLLEMSVRELGEEEVMYELELTGDEFNRSKNINRSEIILNRLRELLRRYTSAPDSIFGTDDDRTGAKAYLDSLNFRLDPERFDEYFARDLKTAFFICEDEESETEYLDAKLMGHVSQNVLPGQFVIYNGKYYRVKHISPGRGVILRRASKLYDSRRYYRQIRNYRFAQSTATPLSIINSGSTVICRQRLDFSVETPGYFDMEGCNALATARLVEFKKGTPTVNGADDPVSGENITTEGVFVRNYIQKDVLKITFRGADHNINRTICVLLQELFRTVFPSAWQYLAVVCEGESDPADRLSCLSYGLTFEKEDSSDKAAAGAAEGTEAGGSGKDAAEDIADDRSAREKFRSIFTGDWGKGIDEITGLPIDKADAPDESVYIIEDSMLDLGLLDAVTKNFTTLLRIIADYTSWHNDGEVRGTVSDAYLAFGYDEIPEFLKLWETADLLNSSDREENPFTKARCSEPEPEFEIDLESINHCDFCGMPLNGVSYERLTDGRVRCDECSRSAINTVDEFRKLFDRNRQMMESFYGIEFRRPITLRTMDAKRIARRAGRVFKPTVEMTARVIGYAQRKHGEYFLNVENGSPRLATISTLIHELTHIWQYINWDDAQLKKYYPDKESDTLAHEGMAVWAEVQYLYLIGEASFAARQEAYSLARDDVYGEGFRAYCERYPLIKNSSMLQKTPFKVFPPIIVNVDTDDGDDDSAGDGPEGGDDPEGGDSPDGGSGPEGGSGESGSGSDGDLFGSISGGSGSDRNVLGS